MEDSGTSHPNAEDFWKRNISQFESCFLSHLAGTASSSDYSANGPVKGTVECHISESTLRFFQQASKTSALTTLQTAWATVLGQYLAANSATFMSVSIGGSGLLQSNLCHVEWDEKTTTGELTKSLENWHKQSLPYQDKGFSSFAHPTPVCDTVVQLSFKTSTPLEGFAKQTLDKVRDLKIRLL
jgi:hypothetical protein